MLNEAVATAEFLKRGNLYVRYVVLTEYLDFSTEEKSMTNKNRSNIHLKKDEKMREIEGYEIFVVENAWDDKPKVNIINPKNLRFNRRIQ
jgi:hypothetical protein